MRNSNDVSQMSLPVKIIVGLFLMLSLIGFGDALYLTITHYRGEIPPCSVIHGCELVTTSEYSKMLGIPVALLGSLYYLTIFLGTVLYLDTKKIILLRIIAFFTITGVLFSTWFIFAQAFLIKAWCQYCLLSAATSTGLWLAGMTFIFGWGGNGSGESSPNDSPRDTVKMREQEV